MFDWIAELLGHILRFIYNFVGNYGVTIILFTIVVKLLILPLTLKSQKSMAKTQKLTPLIQELQRKYANDKQKLNQEMMELYKANDASPTAGCLPLLIQFPIIIALYRAIQAPIKFICQGTIGDDLVSAMASKATEAGFAQNIINEIGKKSEIVISSIADNPVFSSLNIAGWKINYNFLGLDLSRNPGEVLGLFSSNSIIDASTLPILLLILIPVLSGVTSWLITKLNPQQKQQEALRAANPNAEEQPNMGKSLNLMMPLMSVLFTFMLPAGIGLYWIASNVFQLIQQQITFAYFNSKEDETGVINTIKPNRKSSKKHR